MNMSLEVIVLPVSNVDKAKKFYQDKLGFITDMDVTPVPCMRLVQLTPPASNCSIHIGQGITGMKPGSLKGMILVVESAEGARKVLEAKALSWGTRRKCLGESILRLQILMGTLGHFRNRTLVVKLQKKIKKF